MRHKKADTIFKNFWRNNARFADLFNTVIFKKEVLKAEELQEMDTDVSSLLEINGYKETLTRTRDVVKKSANGMEFMVLGIENQQKIHYAMPLRVMVYDALGYLKEYEGQAKEYRKEKKGKTTEEFLSRMKKTDRLRPIITLVIYYNEKPWDGPVSLKDMVTGLPEGMDKVFSDYRMNLLQVRESEAYEFGNADIQKVFEASRGIYKEEFQKIGKMKLTAEQLTMIGIITESSVLIEQAEQIEEGEMDMCTALEKLEKRGIEKGIEQGIEQGIEKGVEKNKKEMVIRMLEEGVDLEVIEKVSGLRRKEIEGLKAV